MNPVAKFFLWALGILGFLFIWQLPNIIFTMIMPDNVYRGALGQFFVFVGDLFTFLLK